MMNINETVTINGKEYTGEEVEQIRNEVLSIWNKIKETIAEVAKLVYEVFKEVIEYLIEFEPVGYKRLLKRDKLIYFESISEGKSNNWRKMHGLPLRRKLRYK